ncbi:MAG: hypothetical protein HN383_05910 [Verrucomicrobia bacterium]|nr:hypothetical protein [Verrucomicrobiota bacterium]MBT7699373.1 hypothetical protein [Verrucomicrobiota bacterium]
MGEADVLSARALYKVTDVLAAFLDVGYYSPDGGADNDVVVQAGVVFEALSFDVANVAVRGAAAYPMADDSDMFLVTGDVVAYRDCEKLEGLRGFVGVGAGYYNWEVDTRFGKFDDSGVELTLSAGADYTILPGLDVGVTLEYVEEPAYSARLRYSF